MATPLGNAIEFLKRFGFYDVILPFLLVFTIIFAVLEKTRILGVEKDGKSPKKNINAMVALVIALFFIAIPRVVVAVQSSLPYAVMLLVVIIAYMLLVGSYAASGDKEFNFAGMTFWKTFMGILVFVILAAVFLNSFGWLDPVWNYITENWQDTFIVSLIFVAFMIGTIYWIVTDKKSAKGGE